MAMSVSFPFVFACALLALLQLQSLGAAAYPACLAPDANCGGGSMTINGRSYCCPAAATGISIINNVATCSGGGSCASSADPCSAYSTCSGCTGGASCGWCVASGSGSCRTGVSSGPTSGSCSSWSWTASSCPGTPSTPTATPVNGGWSAWSTCSSSCTQTRSCTAPSPSNGGSDCVGSSSQACSGGNCAPAEPVQPAGDSCSCVCCSGNYCTARLVGYVSNPGCGSDCSSACRSNFPQSCPSAASSGSMGAMCVTSSSSGSGSASNSQPAGTFSGRTYSGSTCSSAASEEIDNAPVNTCGLVPLWNAYGKVTCSGNTATVKSFADSGCRDQLSSNTVAIGSCGSATVNGQTFSAVVTGCNAAGAAAAASLPFVLLLAAISAAIKQAAW